MRKILTILLLCLSFAAPCRTTKDSGRDLQINGPSGRIAAELLLPRSFDCDKDRCDLVIMMHGFLGNKTRTPMAFLGRVLLNSGHAVLRFDFDGYGKSEGAQEDNTIPGMIEDALAVWEYASRLPFVDRILILGHSQGGLVASMVAGRLEKAGTPPSALILFAPASVIREYAREGRLFSVHCDPGNPPDVIDVYGFKMGREYILSAQTLPIEEEASRYTGPVCLFQGTMDEVVPASCSEWYHDLYAGSRLHLIKTNHIFLYHRGLVRRLLKEYLAGVKLTE